MLKLFFTLIMEVFIWNKSGYQIHHLFFFDIQFDNNRFKWKNMQFSKVFGLKNFKCLSQEFVRTIKRAKVSFDRFYINLLFFFVKIFLLRSDLPCIEFRFLGDFLQFRYEQYQHLKKN